MPAQMQLRPALPANDQTEMLITAAVAIPGVVLLEIKWLADSI